MSDVITSLTCAVRHRAAALGAAVGARPAPALRASLSLAGRPLHLRVPGRVRR